MTDDGHSESVTMITAARFEFVSLRYRPSQNHEAQTRQGWLVGNGMMVGQSGTVYPTANQPTVVCEKPPMSLQAKTAIAAVVFMQRTQSRLASCY